MFKLKYRFMEEANPEGGEGGGGQPQEEQAKTYTQAEVDEMVNGLKAKNDELLSEKKTAAQKAKEAEESRIAAEREAAKKAGELDKFEASLRGEFETEKEALTGKYNALAERVTSSEKKAVLGSFANDFHESASVDLIAQLVKTEFDGTDVKTQYTDFQGNVITTDAAEFKKWMQKHPSISHLMKADAASGGGANGNKGTSGADTGKLSTSQAEAKQKGDSLGFLSASLNVKN